MSSLVCQEAPSPGFFADSVVAPLQLPLLILSLHVEVLMMGDAKPIPWSFHAVL